MPPPCDFADLVDDGLDLGIEPLPEGIVAELETGFDQRGVLLDGEVRIGFQIAEDPALALGHGLIAKLFRRDFIAPLAEGAFGELLDVALVHQRDGSCGSLSIAY